MPPLGIMVETPAAAVAVDLIPADFFSIGSNDLTQYVMAASRDAGGRVAALNDPLHPAVLRLIGRVVEHGEATGTSVSLCGDMASDPAAVDALLRLGLRRLSVAPAALGRSSSPWRVSAQAMPDREDASRAEIIAGYKGLLRSFLERRPSGLRGRLAMALGKHKSFVSQIANPAYTVPIPAGDLPIIFDICHLSPQEREGFLALYRRAHPERTRRLPAPGPRSHELRIAVPEFHSPTTAREVEALILDLSARIIRLAQHAEAAHDEGGKNDEKADQPRRRRSGAGP